MKNTVVRYSGMVGLGFAAVLLFTLLATRVAASPSGVLDACVNPGNGMMRLVNGSTACHNNRNVRGMERHRSPGAARPSGRVR